MAINRSLLIIVAVLLALVTGTFFAGKWTTDYLLYEEATSTAQRWALSLAENVRDLEQIAGGEKPSSLSLQYLTWARQLGLVFRYVIYNGEGYSQLIADNRQIAPVNIAVRSDKAATAGRLGHPVVAVRSGGSDGLPSLFSEAFVPIVANGRLIATVAAYVDQTAQRERFAAAFLSVAMGISLFTGLAFAVPAAAWYRRTREKERADAEIRFLSRHDGMTQLMNRSTFIGELAEALARNDGDDGVALHYIDLDRFKSINETLGHSIGDAVIRAAAERLRETVKGNDILARIGGDEFVIVDLQVAGIAAAEQRAREAIAAMCNPFVINDHAIALTASVGVVLAPRGNVEAERLIRCGKLALERAKEEGRNRFRVFTADMNAELCGRMKLEKRIREAAARQEFELHFQPVVGMPNGRLAGFEALLRLDDESGRPVPPSLFVPVAEQMGLISVIGSFVLRRACATAAQWPSHLTVAVNLSPAQFENGNVYKEVAEALERSGLAPHRLELEITETLLLRDTEAVLAELVRLKHLGVSIAMDDFGTGYSSLRYLWRFPFDKIKIDQSFMQNLNANEMSVRTIVKTIIGLAHSLNMGVTVEGVETEAQAAFVRDVGCDQVQGYYFGRPMAAMEIPSRLMSEFFDGPNRPPLVGDTRLRVAG